MESRPDQEAIYHKIYEEAEEPLYYQDIETIKFENSEISRVQIIASGGRVIDMLFPTDFEREKFKWSLSNEEIEKETMFKKEKQFLVDGDKVQDNFS